MNTVIAYFLNDPLRILYLLGGAGGIWFWVEKWLDRIRLYVRPISHTFDLKADDIEVKFVFEVVNIGKSPTSLSPSIDCVGYSQRRQRETAKLEIADPERLLPPHSTKTFTAIGRINPTYPFWPFKSFRISPTRGRNHVMHFRSNPKKVIGKFGYHAELARFRWLWWLPS
jgi:hypothetical protein